VLTFKRNVNLFIYIYTYVYIIIHAYVYIFMYVYVDIFIFVCRYICTHSYSCATYIPYTCTYKCHSASNVFNIAYVKNYKNNNWTCISLSMYIINQYIYTCHHRPKYIYIYIHLKIWKRDVCLYVHTMYLYISIPL